LAIFKELYEKNNLQNNVSEGPNVGVKRPLINNLQSNEPEALKENNFRKNQKFESVDTTN